MKDLTPGSSPPDRRALPLSHIDNPFRAVCHIQTEIVSSQRHYVTEIQGQKLARGLLMSRQAGFPWFLIEEN